MKNKSLQQIQEENRRDSSSYIPAKIFETQEEIDYKIALNKRAKIFWLFRIFTKKPILKQREIINCRCSSFKDQENALKEYQSISGNWEEDK